MATDSSSWIGQELKAGRYQVAAKLGEGGMGFIYRARDTHLGNEVVVKVPRSQLLEVPGFAARFTREIRSLVRLEHPHVVKIIDVGEHDGVPFAVMQFLGGGNLDDRRPKQDGTFEPVPPESLRSWLEPVADALDFIHCEGYVHRDIKPPNILFDRHGHAYIADFGVAKVVADTDHDPATAKLTNAGMIVGTPHYLAPELLLGKDIDGRIDQYALAVMIYELVNGKPPIDGRTPAEIVVAQVNRQPEPLTRVRPGVPRALSDAVARGLAKEPAARFADCKSLAAAVLSSLPAASGDNLPAPVVHTEPRAASTAQTEVLPEIVRGGTAQIPVEESEPVAVAIERKAESARAGMQTQSRHRGNTPAVGRRPPVDGTRRRTVLALALVAVVALCGLAGLYTYFEKNAGLLTLKLSAPASSVQVWLDGQAIASESLDRPLRIRPAAHLLTITSDAYETVKREFSIGPGEELSLRVPLEPKRSAPPSSASIPIIESKPKQEPSKPAPMMVKGESAPAKPAVFTIAIEPASAKLSVAGGGQVEGTGGQRVLTISAPRLGKELVLTASLEGYVSDAVRIVPQPGENRRLSIKLARVPLEKTFTNSIGMPLVLIAAGECRLGSDKAKSPPGDSAVSQDDAADLPAAYVKIEPAFYLGAHEVTKKQFAEFVRASGYQTTAEKDGRGGWGYNANTGFPEQRREFNWKDCGWPQSEDQPVVNVTWNDAAAFCRWLADKEHRQYRLPTEAEWEYACRAGATTRYSTGDDPRSLEGYANVQDKSFEAKFPKYDYQRAPGFRFDDGWAFAAPVGRFKPNAFGLHDMHGNVAEWCFDMDNPEPLLGVDDPAGKEPHAGRVVRGGGWGARPSTCRCAYRLPDAPADRSDEIGFRVAYYPER